MTYGPELSEFVDPFFDAIENWQGFLEHADDGTLIITARDVRAGLYTTTHGRTRIVLRLLLQIAEDEAKTRLNCHPLAGVLMMSAIPSPFEVEVATAPARKT